MTDQYGTADFYRHHFGDILADVEHLQTTICRILRDSNTFDGPPPSLLEIIVKVIIGTTHKQFQ